MTGLRKSDVEWADYGWSPIVGCRNGCSYCYARNRIAPRLAHLCEKCGTFEPHLHEERLNQPLRIKLPSVIFADSLADWWDHNGLDEYAKAGTGIYSWRRSAMEIMTRANQHHFIVLTKNPNKIDPLYDMAYWPPNAWLGVSITSGADWWRWEALAKLPERIHKFMSVEPLLGPYVADHLEAATVFPEWLIMGSWTGKDAMPPPSVWQRGIRSACAAYGVPLFEKANKRNPLPLQPLIRQMPPELASVYRKGGLT